MSALTVTAPKGAVKLLIMNANEPLPAAFGMWATTAKDRVAIRISGGCKGMGPDDKARMCAYFQTAAAGFAGMVWSGGTRAFTKDGETDPMVTEMPGIIAAGNPGCVALGSAPRTDTLRLIEESRLVLDEYKTGVNPAMSGVLIVQQNAGDNLGWDGDLDAAFKLMGMLKRDAEFSRVGIIAWNGGAVTGDEIMRSAKAGWPTILVKGSGRVTDEIAAKLEANDPELLSQLPSGHQVVTADASDPQTLRAHLLSFGFIKAAA